MSDTLTGKTALVTGASRGIGSAMARGLAAKGATVVINYVKNEKAAQEVVHAIIKQGGKAVAIQATCRKWLKCAGCFMKQKRQLESLISLLPMLLMR